MSIKGAAKSHARLAAAVPREEMRAMSHVQPVGRQFAIIGRSNAFGYGLT
jgi:hypothetical protein